MNLRLRRGKLALALIGWIGVGLSAESSVWLPQAAAGDTACDVYHPSCGQGLCECGNCKTQSNCGCDSVRCSHQRFPNPLYQTLDTVAGGIERLFGLDRCGSVSCDSIACDEMFEHALVPVILGEMHAMPMPEMSPVKPAPKSPAPATPRRQPGIVQPRMPSVPALEPTPSMPKISQPKIVAPLVDPERTLPPSTPTPRQIEIEPRELTPQDSGNPAPAMTQPRIVPAEVEPLLPDWDREPPALPDAVPAMDPHELPKPATPKKEGSIFDSLDDLNDPFEEDARRLRRQYGSIRPDQPKPTTTQRRAPAIGSGLKPVTAIEPLRAVSYEAPLTTPPVANRRVLAPYRPSR